MKRNCMLKNFWFFFKNSIMIGLGLNRSRWPLDHYIEVEVFNRAFDKDMFVEILRIVKNCSKIGKNLEILKSRISRSQVPNWVSSSCSIKKWIDLSTFQNTITSVTLVILTKHPNHFLISKVIFMSSLHTYPFRPKVFD